MMTDDDTNTSITAALLPSTGATAAGLATSAAESAAVSLTTAAAEQPNSKLPYLLYILSSRTIPRTVPPALENQGNSNSAIPFPVENWHAFWSGIKPIIRKAELRDSLLLGAGLIGFVLYVAVINPFVFWHLRFHGRHVASSINIGIYIMLFASWSALYLRLRKTQLQALRRLCHDEAALFRRYGFTVECDFQCYELSMRWSNGFCLYFIPVPIHLQDITTGDELEAMSEVESANTDQETIDRSCEHHGYIRIQTFTSRGLSWNVIDLAMLESYSTLPAGFEESSDGLWTQFWSELVHILKQIQWTCRLYMIILPTYLMLLLGRMAASMEAVVLVFSVAIIGIAFRLVQLMGRRRRLVKQYAPEFERFHVHVEYRSIFEFRGWTGFQEVQYLYVFPPSPAFTRLQASNV